MTSPVGKFAALEQRVANLEEIVARLVRGQPIAGATTTAANVPQPTVAASAAESAARRSLMAELKRMTDSAQHPSNGAST